MKKKFNAVEFQRKVRKELGEKYLSPIFVKCLCRIIEPWSGYPIKTKSLVA